MSEPNDPQADLRWLLLSPTLLSGAGPHGTGVAAFTPTQLAQISHWLQEVDRDPSALRDHLASLRPVGEVPLRIGRYAERLLHFFFSHGPTHLLLASNVVVPHPDPQGTHTTAGEIDFLVEDTAGERHHWELALKYFLATPVRRPGIADYVGPDGSEALARKVLKMERQLALAPPAPWSDHPWRRASFTRGQLYYGVPPERFADELNPQHLQGWWRPFAQWRRDFADAQQVRLDRGHWLARRVWPQAGSCDAVAAELEEVWARAERDDKRQVAQLVAVVTPCPGGFAEVSRGFVLPPGGITGL